MFYFVKIIVCGLIGVFSFIFGKGGQTYVSLKKKLFWNGFFSIVIEAYIEFMIAGYLNVTADMSSYDGEVLSSYLGYGCIFICVLVVPSVFLWLNR